MDPLDLYSLGKIGPIMRREQIERAAEDRLAAQLRADNRATRIDSGPPRPGRLRSWSQHLLPAGRTHRPH